MASLRHLRSRMLVRPTDTGRHEKVRRRGSRVEEARFAPDVGDVELKTMSDGRAGSYRRKRSTSSWAMDAGSSGCRSVCPLLGHRSVQDDKKNDDEDYICHTSPLPQDHWGVSVYQYVFGTSRPDKCNLHAIFATTVLSLATESSLKSGCCIYRNLDPFPVSGRAKLIVMQAASLPAGSVSGANFHTYSAFLTHRQSRVTLRVSSERGWNRPRPQQVPPSTMAGGRQAQTPSGPTMA